MTPPRAASAPFLTVGDLAEGQEAFVAGVCASACDTERLAALGLVPGAHVRLLRRGSTLALAVGEARLALGPSWASALHVVCC